VSYNPKIVSDAVTVVRHREFAGDGWRPSAERLVEHLERRSTRWPG